MGKHIPANEKNIREAFRAVGYSDNQLSVSRSSPSGQNNGLMVILKLAGDEVSVFHFENTGS